jgi:hypothetical protein
VTLPLHSVKAAHTRDQLSVVVLQFGTPAYAACITPDIANKFVAHVKLLEDVRQLERAKEKAARAYSADPTEDNLFLYRGLRRAVQFSLRELRKNQ